MCERQSRLALFVWEAHSDLYGRVAVNCEDERLVVPIGAVPQPVAVCYYPRDQIELQC